MGETTKTEIAEGAAFNPYAPPGARVEAAPITGAEPVFFPVGVFKLMVMGFFTLSLYNVYWFYKNWKCVQQNFNQDVNAPVRAVFYPFIAYPLFRRVRDHARQAGIDARFPPGVLAILLLLVALLGALLDPSGLVTFLDVLLLVPVQSTVNAINRKLVPSADLNKGFTGANIAWITIGGILLIVSLIGTFAA